MRVLAVLFHLLLHNLCRLLPCLPILHPQALIYCIFRLGATSHAVLTIFGGRVSLSFFFLSVYALSLRARHLR
jgi:hypothetical protein